MARELTTALAASVALLLVAACSYPQPQARRVVLREHPPLAAAEAEDENLLGEPAPSPTPLPKVEVPYRVEVWVDDADDFGPLLAETMSDARGWVRAGFVLHELQDAPYTVVLAEGPDVDALCLPYDTGGRFSCQNGPVVAINADRWRHAVPHWPAGDLLGYRQMLLNHEMGHLIGMRHRPCPAPGHPAPVMYQQSGGFGGCHPNPWPLDDEIERAAVHDQKIAPGYGE